MMAYINQASFEMTLRTGEAHYWSRSRNEIWHKGGTSGNIQKIREIYVDCDRDTLLFRVEQVGGAACHTGFETCFHNRLNPDGTMTTVGERMFRSREGIQEMKKLKLGHPQRESGKGNHQPL